MQLVGGALEADRGHSSGNQWPAIVSASTTLTHALLSWRSRSL